MSPKPRNSVPSNTSSATRDCTSPTMSGKPVWRAGKKGVHRVQRDVTALGVRCTGAAGERLRAQLNEGRMVQPTQPGRGWTASREPDQPLAYVGLDAFSVPMQGPRAGAAEHRMLYTALLYTPDKKHTRYLV